MNQFEFCPICRVALEWKHIEGRDRLFCPDCGWVNYKNPLPVVASLVRNDKDEILLIKRGVEPAKGCWALPGGFVELHESPYDAGKRELEEETGIIGRIGRLIGIEMHDSPLYGSIMVIGIEYLPENNDIVVGDDAMDAKFFSQDDLPEVPFKSHKKLIKSFLC